ncbi:MFS general substrate transporter [Aspergillus sclerotiicarbonarius CBS 121057]|uniref:MFS general substrate transporter n=1 Tax=Aspergillus sclerotiicarbonarius (strain CBS 121057 / IBT 28362) TaxID=1448318 RepID=A0A319DWG6_ASPSB|nr:MFS general substrate transporter [Aspergillus sclerotiicarbonarius CBS 121057]
MLEECTLPSPAVLTPEHRQFLFQRHGTLDLEPVPTPSEADPYNWPRWKKTLNLSLVGFHAMMATFTAASIQCSFDVIAADLGVSIQRSSYLASLFIAIIGGAPVFWCPLSNRYGRRPIFLLSLICSLIGNVGCAKSPSYATMALCRAITAFFISPAIALGSAVVAETFFKKDRARCMGVWTLMTTMGVPVAPFIFGFVALRVGYRWTYWILAITNAVQLVLYLCFGSETLYMRNGTDTPPHPPHKKPFFSLQPINPTPLRIRDFLQPFTLALRPCIMLPTAAYSMIFLFGSVFLTIEIPQTFPEKYGFNTQQVGLQFISLIIGSVIGEQVGGYASDQWMWLRESKSAKPPAPEYRLWLAYLGHALTCCGVVVFLIRLGHSPTWNVTPLVGAAVAAAGNQIVTTVNVTYAVDCYRMDAASIGVFVTFVRQIWGFIGPFWFPEMLSSVGYYGSVGIAVGLIVGVSMIPTALLQWKGHTWRKVLE